MTIESQFRIWLAPTSYPSAFFHLFLLMKLEHITEKQNKVTAMLSEQFVLWTHFSKELLCGVGRGGYILFFLAKDRLTSLNALYGV